MSVVEPFDATVGMVNRMGRYAMKVGAPGDPANSSLVKKLTTTLLGNQMPRRKANLEAAQVDTLRAWVTAGAPSDQETPPQRLRWAYAQSLLVRVVEMLSKMC